MTPMGARRILTAGRPCNGNWHSISNPEPEVNVLEVDGPIFIPYGRPIDGMRQKRIVLRRLID